MSADMGCNVEFTDIVADLSGVEREIVRKNVTICEAKRKRAPELRHQRVITIAGIAEMIHPIKIIVHGMVDAVGTVELEEHGGDAEIIQEDSVVGTAANARFGEERIWEICVFQFARARGAPFVVKSSARGRR